MSTQVQPVPHQQETFVVRANRLDRRGHTDPALDLLYDGVDEQMRQGQFGALDMLLATLKVDDFSADMLLGILTATLPAKSRLPSRHRLLQATETVLRRRGEYAEGLLVGL